MKVPQYYVVWVRTLRLLLWVKHVPCIEIHCQLVGMYAHGVIRVQRVRK